MIDEEDALDNDIAHGIVHFPCGDTMSWAWRGDARFLHCDWCDEFLEVQKEDA